MSGSRRRQPRRVGDVLGEVAEQLGLGAELRQARAGSVWARIVEEHVPAARGACRILEVHPPVLVVDATDNATGQEVRLRADELLAAFAAAPGGLRLRELKVVVRPGPRARNEGGPRVD